MFIGYSDSRTFLLKQKPDCNEQAAIGVRVRSDIECLTLCASKSRCTSIQTTVKFGGNVICQLIYSNPLSAVPCQSSLYIKSKECQCTIAKYYK